MSDIDSSSISARHEFYAFKSVESSPSDSLCRNNFTSYRAGHDVQRGQGGSPLSQNDCPFDRGSMAVLKGPVMGTEDTENTDDFADDQSVVRKPDDQSQKPLDFENNGLIWYPPPPDDENDEAESNFFSYDDEDDDVGDSSAMFSSSSSLSSMFPAREKQNEGNKEPLRAVVQGHFRALVSELLRAEGIKLGKEDGEEDWLGIITTIAWQAANFVKPDTSRGGSMDPGDYVKVKCIAKGSPNERYNMFCFFQIFLFLVLRILCLYEFMPPLNCFSNFFICSTFIKGVVCTKNIKHKRMTSQYRNPRLLILGGALEYQRVPNQLASFNTLLQQVFS